MVVTPLQTEENVIIQSSSTDSFSLLSPPDWEYQMTEKDLNFTPPVTLWYVRRFPVRKISCHILGESLPLGSSCYSTRRLTGAGWSTNIIMQSYLKTVKMPLCSCCGGFISTANIQGKLSFCFLIVEGNALFMDLSCVLVRRYFNGPYNINI